MATKQLKTRVKHKIDTSANWALATTFIPLKGELIIYSDTKKIKIGDGESLLSDLSFASYSISEVDNLLEGKASASDFIDHIEDVENPHEVTKAQVGLSNVDNTSDANKPISSATQSALDLKANQATTYTKTEVDAGLEGKVDKVSGKQLSTEDYTTSEKTKLSSIEAGAQVNVIQSDAPSDNKEYARKNGAWAEVVGGVKSVNSKTGDVILSASDVSADPAGSASTVQTGVENGTIIAGKASKDASGNIISSTYGTKEEVSAKYTKPADGIPKSDLVSSVQTSLEKADSAVQDVSGKVNYTDKLSQITGSMNTSEKSSVRTAIGAGTGDGTITKVQANSVDVASSGVANIPAASTSTYGVTELVDDVTSTETRKALTANQGKILNDRIDSLATIGRFLSIWNATTGLPTSNPPSSPYTYHTGDYFRVANISTTATDNLIPNGTSYTSGVASTTHYTPTVQRPNLEVGDIYYFDGTGWILEPSGGQGLVQDVQVDGATVVSGGIADITLGAFDVTADSEEINILDGATLNTSELNVLDGITASTEELNYTDGVTSNIQTQLDSKAESSALTSHTSNTSNPHSVTKSQVGLGNVDNTSDANKPISTATQTALDNKVDKVSGKGLSTNDFTNAEKTKLGGIAEGAEVNVQSDWNQTTTSADDYIKNKPTALSSFTDDINDVKYTSQTLSSSQQLQARDNIGAGNIGSEDISSPSSTAGINANTLEGHASSYFATTANKLSSFSTVMTDTERLQVLTALGCVIDGNGYVKWVAQS